MSTERTDEKKAPTAKTVEAKSITPLSNGEAIVEESSEDDAKNVGLMQVNEKGEKWFVSPSGASFFIDRNNVYVKKVGQERQFVCSRIDVVAEGCDADGTNRKTLLRFKDREGRDHEYIINRSDLVGSASSVVSALVNNGLQYVRTSYNGSNASLIEYLNACPTNNSFLTANYFGWYRRGKVFVIPDRVIGKLDGDVELRYTGETRGAPEYGVGGTLEDWKRTIGTNAQYSSRVSFAICIGFAAPLLPFTTCGTGGFHLVGVSSTGKSSSARALCSVWAKVEPNGGGELGNWKATDNGLEVAAASRNHLPVIIDELGQCDPKKLESVIYMFGNSTGKARATRSATAQKRNKWLNMFLSTGELTADEMVKKVGAKIQTGAAVRMATVPACPNEGSELGIYESLPDWKVEKGSTVGQVLSNSFLSHGSEYYGTAGIAFIERFINHCEQIGGDAQMQIEINRRMETWKADNAVGVPPTVGRVADRFALVAVAGELATEYGVLPWKEGDASRYAAACFNAFLEVFETPACIRADLCEKPFDYLQANHRLFSFFPPSEDSSFTREADGNVFHGFVLESCPDAAQSRGSPCMIFFNTKGFNAAGGQDTAEMRKALKAAGRLISDKDGKHGYKVGRKPLLGRVTSGRYWIVLAEEEYPEEVANYLKNSNFSR